MLLFYRLDSLRSPHKMLKISFQRYKNSESWGARLRASSSLAPPPSSNQTYLLPPICSCYNFKLPCHTRAMNIQYWIPIFESQWCVYLKKVQYQVSHFRLLSIIGNAVWASNFQFSFEILDVRELIGWRLTNLFEYLRFVYAHLLVLFQIQWITINTLLN